MDCDALEILSIKTCREWQKEKRGGPKQDE
jgi:hypothetical protein